MVCAKLFLVPEAKIKEKISVRAFTGPETGMACARGGKNRPGNSRKRGLRHGLGAGKLFLLLQ
jgi:hypothetical protein